MYSPYWLGLRLGLSVVFIVGVADAAVVELRRRLRSPWTLASKLTPQLVERVA